MSYELEGKESKQSGNEIFYPATGNINIITANPHESIDAFYEYSGGVCDGTMIVPHIIESDRKYIERRSFSSYVNLFAPAIDAQVRPVFDKLIERTTSSAKLEAFWKDCDVRGTKINNAMRRNGETVRAHSTTFVIMDNYSLAEQPATDAEAIAKRIFPYIYTKKPQDVKEYKLGKRGELLSITFYNGEYEAADEKGEKHCYTKYLRLDDNEIYEYYIDAKNNEREISINVNALGRIPVVVMRDAVPDCGELCAAPKSYGMMRISHSLFNKDSEMRELERKQLFSLLTMENKTGAPPSDVAAGSANVLFYADGAKVPAYVEPNPAILLGLLQTRNALREDFLFVAGQSGVLGVQTAKSGTAMAFEFMARESVIVESMEICQNAENEIAQMFLDMTNESNATFEIKYSTSYTPADDAMQLKFIDAAFSYEMPDAARNAAAVMLLQKLDPHAKAETILEMVDQMKSDVDNRLKDETANEGDTV